MKQWITAVLGAGTLATLYSFRTYIGIGLVLMVTTCSFKPEIVNYISTSRDQAHQERMAQLQAQQATEQLNAAQELKILQAKQAAEAQARADQLKAEQADRADQLKLERERAKNLPPPTAPVNTRVNFNNGDWYYGGIANGSRNGWGTYYWTNGNRYEGNWVADRRTGYGTIYYANGTNRSGQWVNDIPQF